jgi:hypothetical protein
MSSQKLSESPVERGARFAFFPLFQPFIFVIFMKKGKGFFGFSMFERPPDNLRVDGILPA